MNELLDEPLDVFPGRMSLVSWVSGIQGSVPVTRGKAVQGEHPFENVTLLAPSLGQFKIIDRNTIYISSNFYTIWYVCLIVRFMERRVQSGIRSGSFGLHGKVQSLEDRQAFPSRPDDRCVSQLGHAEVRTT